jgi:molybdopterin converting factor small subunit
MTNENQITITVKLFAFFRENRFKKQEQQFPATATVREIIRVQGIDPEEVGVTMINSRHCTLEQTPIQGDQLAIFPVIGGG